MKEHIETVEKKGGYSKIEYVPQEEIILSTKQSSDEILVFD
jgi:hypothetical protein